MENPFGEVQEEQNAFGEVQDEQDEYGPVAADINNNVNDNNEDVNAVIPGVDEVASNAGQDSDDDDLAGDENDENNENENNDNDNDVQHDMDMRYGPRSNRYGLRPR
jgi:hypothetical protein